MGRLSPPLLIVTASTYSLVNSEAQCLPESSPYALLLNQCSDVSDDDEKLDVEVSGDYQLLLIWNDSLLLPSTSTSSLLLDAMSIYLDTRILMLLVPVITNTLLTLLAVVLVVIVEC